jgi:hypothetical protein
MNDATRALLETSPLYGANASYFATSSKDRTIKVFSS